MFKDLLSPVNKVLLGTFVSWLARVPWLTRVLCLAGAFWLAGCAAMNNPVKSVYDPMADFTNYRTFTIEAVQAEQQYVHINRMIRASMARNLQQKGFALAEATGDPDLKVRFATEVQSISSVDIEYIPTDQGIWTRYFSDPVTEGRLLVNILDTGAGTVVWKGVTSKAIDRSREATKAEVDQAVDELLRSFPPE